MVGGTKNMSWEDILKNAELVPDSDNLKWRYLKDELNRVNRYAYSLQRDSADKQARKRIEDRYIGKATEIIASLRKELEEYINNKQGKMVQTKLQDAPVIETTEPPKDPNQMSLGHPWGQE